MELQTERQNHELDPSSIAIFLYYTEELQPIFHSDAQFIAQAGITERL